MFRVILRIYFEKLWYLDGDLPVYLINLKRHAERRRKCKSLLKSCGFTRIRILEAVDGQQLLLEGAGARKQSSRLWRLTYNRGVQRESFNVRTSSLGNFDGTCMWGQHACAGSHHKAVLRVLDLLNVENIWRSFVRMIW